MIGKIRKKRRIGKIGAFVVMGILMATMLTPSVVAQDDDWTGAGTGTMYATYTSDKIGIGETAPNFKLEVKGTSGSGYFGVTSSSDGDIFIIDGSGNVGIGTTSPSYNLHIRSTSTEEVRTVTETTTTTYSARMHVISGSSSGYIAAFGNNYGITPFEDKVFLVANSDSTALGLTSQAATGRIEFYTGGFQTAYERMRITSDGDVGIGDTSPDFKLEVTGYSGSGYFGVTSSSDGDIFKIDNNGKVGIGTASPGAKLHSLATTEQLRLGYDTSNYASFTIASDGDLSVIPTGSGQVIFQPTTDSTGFFRVYSANQAKTILNIDTSNIRIGIGVPNPAEILEIDGNVIFNTGANRKIYVERPFNLYGEDGYDLTVQAGKACAKQVGYEGRPGGDLFLRAGDGDGYPGGGGGRVYIFGGISDASAYSAVVLAHDGTAAAGRVGIGTTSPTGKLDINGDDIRIRTSQTPASCSAAGYTGEIAWDSYYIYVCISGDGPGPGGDTWGRAALTTSGW